MERAASPPGAAPGFLTVSGAEKTFGAARVLDGVDLSMARGEFVSLLGPSGCGKTTLLRIVAGLMAPDRGRVVLDGQDITRRPPHKRDVGVVFQSYALFPHLDVRANVAFGLKARGVPAARIGPAVERLLSLVRMEAYADRSVKALSGGQQQRVAVARALVVGPKLLLLDEPFSALDRKLREAMQIDLKRILREVGTTAVFVTHDQDEALSIADRVVLMRAGRIEQAGAPDDLFERPGSHFVAEFMGVTNLLAGEAAGSGRFRLKSGEVLSVPMEARSGRMALALRPERLVLDGTDEALLANTLTAEVAFVTYRGLVIDYRLVTPSGLTLIARRPSPAVGGPAPLAAGRPVRISWQPDAGVLVPV